ncbi:MAG: hypothetical protein D6737_05270 [Chloroflexi bacterium]|nr:MAG: hypothetical protein D6737_05270 [Chloroflexota bacterium]
MARWTTFEEFLAEARSVDNDRERQDLVVELLRDRTEWPWITGNRATFVYSRMGTKSAAVNLDTIERDPPFEPMTNLPGTSLWYVTLKFAPDDLLDYLLAINDPMTPLAQEKDIRSRLEHWHPDQRNPLRMRTPEMDVSVLRMPYARPFPDWSAMAMQNVPRGNVVTHTIDSVNLNMQGRKVWVYAPYGYAVTDMAYPLLIMQDGQWNAGPLQVASIVDVLAKHQHVQPMVVAMVQSAGPRDRENEYIDNDNYSAFVINELLPFLTNTYRIRETDFGIGGVAAGAVAAAHVALAHADVFTRLIMISPPLGRGRYEEQLRQYNERFAQAMQLPKRIFQSVGRYEMGSRFYEPAQRLKTILEQRDDVAYKYVEIGSGHGLVNFRAVMPEALSWAFPGVAAKV